MLNAEYAAREWVYYRMLEVGVLVNFEPRDSWMDLVWSAASVWILSGTTALFGLAIDLYHDRLDEFPIGALSNVGMTAILMVVEVHRTRQLPSRLTSINTLVNTVDKQSAIGWLSELEVMEESTVQYHFLHISEHYKNKAIRKQQMGHQGIADSIFARGLPSATSTLPTPGASSPDGSADGVPMGMAVPGSESSQDGSQSVDPLLDFSKVGREGFTKEAFEQLPQRKLCPNLFMALGGSSWASSIPARSFLAQGDRKFMHWLNMMGLACFIISLVFVLGGITTQRQAASMFTQFLWNITHVKSESH
eukprot:7292704-Prymnesium_polylepis.1